MKKATSTPNKKTVNSITESPAEESRRKALRASLLSSRSKGLHNRANIGNCLKNYIIMDYALDVLSVALVLVHILSSFA